MSERETPVQVKLDKLGIIVPADPTLEEEEKKDNTELENNISILAEYCNHEGTIVRGRIGALGIAAGFIDEDVFALQIDDGKDVVLIYSKDSNSISISTGDKKRGYYSREHIGRLNIEDAQLLKDAVSVLNNEYIRIS